MRHKSNICIVGPDPAIGYVGGVATHVRNLLKFSPLKDAFVYDMGSLSPSKGLSDILSIIRRLIRLRALIRNSNFSLVILNHSLYNFSFVKALLTVLVLPKRNCTDAVSIHVYFHGGSILHVSKCITFAAKYIFGSVFNKVLAFHFLVEQQKVDFDSFFSSSNTRLFSNFADCNHLIHRSPSPSNVLRILFVGRIVKAKGIFDLLEAFNRLHQTHHDTIQLKFVGDGEDIEELKARAHHLPSDAVSFAGFLKSEQLVDVYSNSDILVLPSYTEAFPYVVIEAMRAGVPIIATSVGALNELVQDGVTGFKVAIRDPDSIVEAISDIISNKSLLQAMSANCHCLFMKQLSLSSAESYYSTLCEGASNLPPQ